MSADLHGQRLLIVVLTGVLSGFATGCRYDGSFLQMDSNSSAPFLGLQLSVDSRNSQKTLWQAAQDTSDTAHRFEPPTSLVRLDSGVDDAQRDVFSIRTR